MPRDIRLIWQGVLLVAHEAAHERRLVLVNLSISATLLSARAWGMVSLFREIGGVKREDRPLPWKKRCGFVLIRVLDPIRGPWGTPYELLDAPQMYMLLII
jgi:hypothetical protein